MIETTLTWRLTSEEKPEFDEETLGMFVDPEGSYIEVGYFLHNQEWEDQWGNVCDVPFLWMYSLSVTNDPVIQEAIEQARKGSP